MGGCEGVRVCVIKSQNTHQNTHTVTYIHVHVHIIVNVHLNQSYEGVRV